MVDICDHHRAIRNHYETTILPVIYWAASNYFLGWGGCHLQEHLLLRRGYELIFMEDLMGRVQSSEHEPEHSYILEMQCPRGKQTGEIQC